MIKIISRATLYIILGYFNMEPNCPSLTSFMQSLDLFNLIETNTCYIVRDSSIDLILTNRKYYFKHSSTFETGHSDHHHVKTCFKKEESKTLVI